jgi:glycosyltransferase involved in cell wall biosynthesis
VKIAINARWLLPDKLEGFGWYTLHIVHRLSKLMPEATFHLITDRKVEPLAINLNITYHVVPPPARHPHLWFVWNEISVPLFLKFIKADLYFSPDGFIPSNLKIPTITTIHDLNFENDDIAMPLQVRKYYKKHMRKAAEKATHIFTISQFSADDIAERYGISKEKITVAYNGPQKVFSDLRNMKRSTRQHYAGARPYFLFVGAQNPRKNLHRIFQAFDAYASLPGSNHHLVLVGEKMLWNEEIQQAWDGMQHQQKVHFTERLSTAELNRVYSGATALVFPSLHEGFGMPVVEAFYAACPVITSKTTALKEVASNAALLIDPADVSEITEAMGTLSAQPDLCLDYIARGLARAEFFRWDDAAHKLVQTIKLLLDAKKG